MPEGEDADTPTTGGPTTLCRLPQGAVPIEVIEVCGYIAPDGSRKFAVRACHDVPLSTALGLLRLAEHHLVEESKTWE